MQMIDLRSDTVTHPTAAMRRAMAEAQVGDDVFGEDPTVNRLEELAAERLGKEAALFVSSGTMANLVCQLTHCGRGEEMILGDQSHIFHYEQGGSAAVGGIHPRIIPNRPDGTLDLTAVEASVRAENVHFPRTRLLVLENTHNRCDGAPLPPEYMSEAASLARRHGMKLHVDGARIFNAAVALGIDVRQLSGSADSIWPFWPTLLRASPLPMKRHCRSSSVPPRRSVSMWSDSSRMRSAGYRSSTPFLSAKPLRSITIPSASPGVQRPRASRSSMTRTRY